MKGTFKISSSKAAEAATPTSSAREPAFANASPDNRAPVVDSATKHKPNPADLIIVLIYMMINYNNNI